MDAETSARLDAALAAIQQRWGVSSVRLLGDTSSQQGLTTGFSALDHALAPVGIPYGAVTELVGSPTSGMTSLAYAILHRAQTQGSHVLYIDLQSTFDPTYAARQAVDLSRLFLARPQDNFQALDIAHQVLTRGSRLIIALDFGTQPPALVLLRRLSSTLSKSGCIVLLLLPASRRSNSDTPSVLRLLVERVAWQRRGQDISGWRAGVTILYRRGAPAGSRVEIDIALDGRSATP